MTDGDYKELRAMPALAEKLNGKHAVWLTATDSSLILFHARDLVALVPSYHPMESSVDLLPSLRIQGVQIRTTEGYDAIDHGRAQQAIFE